MFALRLLPLLCGGVALAALVGCPSGAGSDDNNPPTAPEIDLAPAVPGADDDLVMTIVVESEDPDGDDVDYTITWTVDGEEVPQLDGSDTVTASRTSAGEVWEVTVVADDGADDSDPATASVTIANAAPEITSVTTTSPVYTDDVIYAWYETFDFEGDAVDVLLEWYVNGQKITEGESLHGIGNFDKHDDVYVLATPSDAYGTGAPVASETVTVLNTAPTQPTVAIEPAEPEAGEDDLVCTVVVASTDDDQEDQIQYIVSWTRDGNAYAGAAVVPAGETAAGEVWQCTVTATDGEATSDPASDSVTVAAALPDLVLIASVTTLTEGVYEYDLVTVNNGGRLYIDGHVQIIANEFHVLGSTSTVDGAGRGAVGPSSGAGTGPGGGGGGTNTGAGGGGYGGAGGDGGRDSGETSAAGGSTYGDYSSATIEVGSSGGGAIGMSGGNGGAALHVVAENIWITGIIDMSGDAALPLLNCSAGNGTCAGGGSGGGILLVGDDVTISGVLDVSGGDGATGSSSFNDGGGGGGGGRVKIFYDTNFADSAIVYRSGGDGGTSGSAMPAEDGRSGTQYTAQQPF
jgi:hypothetical protein